MKKILLIFLFLALNVSALQEINITIESPNADLCITSGLFNESFCNGETLILNGTKDSEIIIIPETYVTENSNITAKFEYAVFTPINIIIGGLGFLIVVLLMTIAVSYAFAQIMLIWFVH